MFGYWQWFTALQYIFTPKCHQFYCISKTVGKTIEGNHRPTHQWFEYISCLCKSITSFILWYSYCYSGSFTNCSVSCHNVSLLFSAAISLRILRWSRCLWKSLNKRTSYSNDFSVSLTHTPSQNYIPVVEELIILAWNEVTWAPDDHWIPVCA